MAAFGRALNRFDRSIPTRSIDVGRAKVRLNSVEAHSLDEDEAGAGSAIASSSCAYLAHHRQRRRRLLVFFD